MARSGSKSSLLEFAVLGLLHDAPMHGYELRKRLNGVLGTFHAISYGSLYPCLRTLESAGLIAAAGPATVIPRTSQLISPIPDGTPGELREIPGIRDACRRLVETGRFPARRCSATRAGT